MPEPGTFASALLSFHFYIGGGFLVVEDGSIGVSEACRPGSLGKVRQLCWIYCYKQLTTVVDCDVFSWHLEEMCFLAVLHMPFFLCEVRV